MPALKLEQFGGELPAWDQRLLPPGQAALSVNGYLFSGRLEGWRKPKVLRSLTNPAARFAYRIPTLQEVQARAYLVFKAQPVALDTLTIGDFTYRWRTSGSTLEIGDVVIGPTVTDTVTNLIAALTADNGTNENAGVLYGLNTTANSDIKWYEEGQDAADGLVAPAQGIVNIAASNYTFLQVGATDFGSAFNTVEVAESTANVRTTWLLDLLAFADTTTTLYGGTNPTFTNDITSPATWLEFADADTNVLKSSVVDDKWQRYYAASPSQPPKYNPYDRILAGMPFWLLGVPAPGCAPIVTVEGGSSTLVMGTGQTVDGSQTTAANSITLVKITPTGAASLNSITFTTSSGQADAPLASYLPVLYADANGIPGDLLNVGPQVFGVSGGGGTNVGSFTNPTALTSDISYWAGFMIDTAIDMQRGGGADEVSFSNTFSNGAPSTAPAASAINAILLTATATADAILAARSYLYTWVTAYNEEGPPSPTALVNGWSNGTWTIGLWQPPANDIGILRNITSINLYRTVVGIGGSTVFFKVANIPLGVDSYVDNNGDELIALNVQLPSTEWTPPPENLQGLISMPNGIMAGFASNQIWFCDPYHPHAWPPGFVLTTEFPIIGLGLTNGALVAVTGTLPYIVQGNAPGSMTLTKGTTPNPCVSRGSIVNGDDHVSYVSPNGLIQVTPQGVVTNTTDLWVTREQWLQKAPQRYARAIRLASCYYCFGTTSPQTVVPVDNSLAQTGFTIELDDDSNSFTIWPQPGGHRLGFNELLSPIDLNIDNVLTDPWTGYGLLIANAKVYWFDFSDLSPDRVAHRWKSKIYVQNNQKSFAAMKVWFTVPDSVAALNAFRIELPADDPTWAAALPLDRYGYIKTYADWAGDGKLTLIDCREIRKSGELLRIVSGFKAEQWQFEIVSRVVISQAQIATTAKELSNV